ncbi:MAG TPA: helix-turn-helix domain-containing protein, partial [Gemmatimonadales bacterium]|nr:helix-turn-helix domain-containing protein [Gemmatimonadales bacterium]
FREDLYYRLSVMPLKLPPLRERSREDRLALVTRILLDLGPQMPGCPSGCSAEALDRLLSAAWPGNVREMRNVLERAMILGRGVAQIGVEHLPADLRRGSGPGGGGTGGGGGERRHSALTLADVERQQIERALKFHGGNRTRAAQELGISRATLINKIKAYALDL